MYYSYEGKVGMVKS